MVEWLELPVAAAADTDEATSGAAGKKSVVVPAVEAGLGPAALPVALAAVPGE